MVDADGIRIPYHARRERYLLFLLQLYFREFRTLGRCRLRVEVGVVLREPGGTPAGVIAASLSRTSCGQSADGAG